MYDILNSLDIKPYNEKRLNLKSLTITATDEGMDILELLRADLPVAIKKRAVNMARSQVKVINHFCAEYDKATWKLYKKLEGMRELLIPKKKLAELIEEKKGVMINASMVVDGLKDFIEVCTPDVN